MVGILYQVVLVENPSPSQIRENDAISKVVLGPVFICARDEQTACMHAAKKFSDMDASLYIGDQHECVVVHKCDTKGPRM